MRHPTTRPPHDRTRSSMSQRWADPFQATRGDSLGRSMPQHRCKPHKAISNATSQPCWMALPRLDSPARRPHHGHEHRRAANYRHSAVASSRHRATARGFLPQGLSNTCPQAGAMRSPVPSRGQVSNKPKRKQSARRAARTSEFSLYGELSIKQRVFCLADAARRLWPSGRRRPASGRQKIPLD